MNNRTNEAAGTRGAVYSTEIPTAPGYYVYRPWSGDECIYVGRTGECRACGTARRATPEAKAAKKLREAAPARRAKKKEGDRTRQPLHNAAKRRRRRAAGPGQGSLW